MYNIHENKIRLIMNKLVLIALCASSLYADGSFKKNIQYSCLNTHNMQHGQRMNIDQKEASEQPFLFIIKEDKIVTNDNIVFDFKMKKGLMSSYSNSVYMLLLTPDMVMGLVPRKAKGSVQYYFSCKSK